MAASNHLINNYDQKIGHVKNQIINHQIRRKIKATSLVKFFVFFLKIVGVCCTWQAPGPKHITVSL